MYIKTRERPLIAQYIKYIQLTLNINRYVHYNDMIN